LQYTPSPTGALVNSLGAVSCVSATACEALGQTQSAGDAGAPFGEAWNGTAWTLQTIPAVSGATFSGLPSLSCTSANACTAVGATTDGAGTQTLISEQWNGTAWSMQPMAQPAGTQFQINSVSCPAANACEAVGVVVNGSAAPLAEFWNGTAWSIQPISSAGSLTAVSCSAANSCQAVGFGTAESWNGTAWTAETVPTPANTTGLTLFGVSCPSANSCEAVGNAGIPASGPTNPGGEAVVASWNGNAWTSTGLTNPTGEQEAALNSISCTTAGSCEAVGSQDTQGNSFGVVTTLAENWNGLSWSVDTTPAADISNLTSVSCAPTCEAVGDQTNTGPLPQSLPQMAEVKTTPLATTPPPTSGGGGLAGLLTDLLGLVTTLLGAL
jgi:hypothetical protein